MIVYIIDKHHVEDEFHGLMICDLNNVITHALFEYCHQACPMLQHMSLDDVFFILSDSNVTRQTAIACHNILNW